ncbi:N-6 DNA methylase [Microbacterium sp. NPDC090003]|uniref:N-6 DNA methylase n=1 Tax=Microbacterium sp. NPDC090003 TaxID=3364203 RepID=UPI0037F932C2
MSDDVNKTVCKNSDGAAAIFFVGTAHDLHMEDIEDTTSCMADELGDPKPCRSLDAMPSAPATPFTSDGIHEDGALLWLPLRGTWVDATNRPEERVRQEWLRKLHMEGGYALEQMGQELRTVHGRRAPRADIVVWASVQDKAQNAEPVLVVETKAGTGAVQTADFWQGDSYARAAGARFLILANESTSVVYEVTKGMPGSSREINDWPKLADLDDAQRLNELVNQLEVFDREQFQRVLFECHTLLRDNHAMTPDRAFDTISKVLFIKLDKERTGAHQTFTTGYLDDWVRFNGTHSMSAHEAMFAQTKDHYSADELFPPDDKLDISVATFREIVAKLERFNLSKTGEDIKGIAFERFLGRTFRGELGQFFTPRPVVDFIVQMLDPQEGELICDPASGSGGFLIRTFEHIREAITADVTRQREAAIERISADYATTPDGTVDTTDEKVLAEYDARVAEAVTALTAQLAPTGEHGERVDTRMGRLAWEGIFGTDKEPRAARTAKMNMIMHGDGHGGIHWHDGLVDTHGVFEGRFDVVVTNPPFGATVTTAQLVGATPETQVPSDKRVLADLEERYGDEWAASHARVKAAYGAPILEQYEIGRGNKSRKTEQLFLERCLRLLKPGGRVGIVLPNGNLNAASQSWLRRWAEGRAFLRAVVSLPAATFKFSGASVTASILVLEKFTQADTEEWERVWTDAEKTLGPTHIQTRDAAIADALPHVLTGGDAHLQQLVDDLATVGATPVLEAASVPQTGLVRSGPRTVLRPLRWARTPGKATTDLLRRYTSEAAKAPETKAALSSLRSRLRELDDEYSRQLWKQVREAFDYPVFMATPDSVGITATGDTGEHVPNDLPEVLAAWNSFKAAS